MEKETGYFIDSKRRIVGPEGPTNYELNGEDELFFQGAMTDVYIENGHFFRCRKRFWIFGCCSPTGHKVLAGGKISGNGKKLPWA